MLTIRLQRKGKKHDPSYRVVLVDSRRAAKSGSVLEILGSYNPQKGEPQLKPEKIKTWISKGARPSDTAHNLFVKEKIIEAEKKDVLHHTKIKAKLAKKKPKEEKPVEEKLVESSAPVPEVDIDKE